MNQQLADILSIVIVVPFSPLVIISYFIESKMKGAMLGLAQGVGVSFYSLFDVGQVGTREFIYSTLCVLAGFILGSISEKKARLRKLREQEYINKLKNKNRDE